MKYIGTSWKMNHTPSQAKEYADILAQRISSIDLNNIVPFVIPPFTSIEQVRSILPLSVWVGAQNVHWLDKGAYTGEISALMLKEIGIDIVEIGHSERRKYFNETDQTVGLKAKQSISKNLRPLICIGESRVTMKKGQSIEYLNYQIQCSLKNITSDEVSQVIFAYEPIWAIGEDGIVAEPEYIRAMIKAIKKSCNVLFPENTIPVLYGGSITKDNSETIFSLDNCDGLFIGRSAWTADGFVEILQGIASI